MPVIDKRWYPGKNMDVWVKRGGTGSGSNSGPTGRRARPAARLQRSLADMAASYGVVNGIKKKVTVRKKA